MGTVFSLEETHRVLQPVPCPLSPVPCPLSPVPGPLQPYILPITSTSAIPTTFQYQDRPNIARFQCLTARLHTLRGDIPAAHAALTEAIDLFERLGMRRELAEARQALADLDARDVVDTSG
jgi:hypothetical protein